MLTVISIRSFRNARPVTIVNSVVSYILYATYVCVVSTGWAKKTAAIFQCNNFVYSQPILIMSVYNYIHCFFKS